MTTLVYRVDNKETVSYSKAKTWSKMTHCPITYKYVPIEETRKVKPEHYEKIKKHFAEKRAQGN